MDITPSVELDTDRSVVHVDAKFGIDGSGRHKLRQQDLKNPSEEESINKAPSNYVCAVWCPLRVQV